MREHHEFRTDTYQAMGVDGLSLRGRRRENQDYCLADTQGETCIAILCDGLGGSTNGGLASSYAARKFHHEFIKNYAETYSTKSDIERRDICQKIITEIQGILTNSDELKGSSTTFTCMIICKKDEPIGDVVHLGDTRCYFEVGRDEYSVKTDDHTIAGDLFRDGSITRHEIPNTSGSNVLTRYLGSSEEPEIQFLSNRILPRVAILCSDGVWAPLHGEDGLVIPDFQNSDLATELVQNAIIQNSADNCTAVVVNMEEI